MAINSKKRQDDIDYMYAIATMCKKADERLAEQQRNPNPLTDKFIHSNLNLQDENGWSLLFIAAANDKVDEIRSLVSLGASINLTCSSNGWTALMNSASFGLTSSVIELLSLGADATICSMDGLTAMDIAKANGHTQVVRVLEKYFELLSHR